MDELFDVALEDVAHGPFSAVLDVVLDVALKLFDAALELFDSVFNIEPSDV